jgi:YgiT-type zinc finger domain-containing protein
MIEITHCPSCGSDKIDKVRRDWSGEFQGKKYTVSGLEFHECPVCAEKVFDRDAMRRIEACSPAFAKPRRMKRSA